MKTKIKFLITLIKCYEVLTPFFKLLFKKQILNSFSSSSYPNKKNNGGDVIRYLAQKV